MSDRSLICAVGGCGRPNYNRGLCAGHHRQRVLGEPFHDLRPYRVDAPHECQIHAPGSTGCYNTHNCRCRECRIANGAARKRRVGRPLVLVEHHRVALLLRALTGRGWLLDEIEDVSGIHRRHLEEIRRDTKRRLMPETVRKVVAAYEKLIDADPPRTRAQARGQSIAHAIRQGWATYRVSAVDTNRHLRALSAMGWLDAEIAKVAVLTKARVCHLRFASEADRLEAVGVEAAYNYLSVRLPPRDGRHQQRRTRAAGLGWRLPAMWDRFVPGLGTNRRLQALSALGWLDEDIAHAAGLTEEYVRALRTSHWVDLFGATSAKAAYTTLSMKLPPQDDRHQLCRAEAAARGWYAPLAWDDEDLDSPEATPINPPGEKFRGKAHIEDIEWMIRAGATMDEITKRTGLTRDGVDRALRRQQRFDLLSMLIKTKDVAA